MSFQKVLSIFVLVIGFASVRAGTFEIGEKDFLLNQQPFVVRSGELHFSRIPQEYWRHRLQMCKAMGLNTVCAYLFWNAHEPEPGEFNFEGRADLAEFCRLAQEEGLLIILRPGPYSCAEWDLGGFPYWLLKDDTMKLRTQHPGYLAACRKYIMAVGKELSPLQITRGGPIIMVQVENEYGSYGSDKEYIGIIRDNWQQAGFEVPFFMCDGPRQAPNDKRNDIFSVVNFGSKPEVGFEALRKLQANGPLMCGEFYPAWFDHWGNAHQTKGVEEILPPLEYMLKNRASFSLYMVHGGTSFGFTAGANYADRFKPQTTSYDYDAPISEAGWETPKFLELRKLYSHYLNPGESIPDIPDRNPVIAIPEIRFKKTTSLFDHPESTVKSRRPKPLEVYNQNQGCVLYSTTIPSGKAGNLKFKAINDFAHVYMDGKKIATYDRRANPGRWVTGFNDKGQNIIKSEAKEEFRLNFPVPRRKKIAKLEVFVESMGHINYGAVIDTDRKGILGRVLFETNGKTTELTGWTAELFPLDENQLSRIKFGNEKTKLPAWYRQTFNLDEVGDTFLDMRNWKKGVVWVNGHNLGRYWYIGPSRTLYLPGPWLKKGKNEILVLELLDTDNPAVTGLKIPILDQSG